MSIMKGLITELKTSFLHDGGMALIPLNVFKAPSSSNSSQAVNAIMSPFGVICILHNSLIQLSEICHHYKTVINVDLKATEISKL